MIIIPVINTGTADCPLLAPATPIPVDAVAVTCDGANYTVYEIGDPIETATATATEVETE